MRSSLRIGPRLAALARRPDKGEAGRSSRSHDAVQAFVHQTYELYFRAPDAPPRFEAATCDSMAALIALARKRLADEGCERVEVWQFGAHLFTLDS